MRYQKSVENETPVFKKSPDIRFLENPRKQPPAFLLVSRKEVLHDKVNPGAYRRRKTTPNPRVLKGTQHVSCPK